MNKNPNTNGNKKAVKLQSVLKVTAVGVIIFSILIVSKSLQRTIVSLEDFQTVMEANGFKVADINAGDSDELHMEKNGIVVEYYLMAKEDAARHTANLIIAGLVDSDANSFSSRETSTSLKEYLKIDDTFFLVHQHENALFYAISQIDDAEIIEALDRELMPGNPVLVFIVFVSGAVLAGSILLIIDKIGAKRERGVNP